MMGSSAQLTDKKHERRPASKSSSACCPVQRTESASTFAGHQLACLLAASDSRLEQPTTFLPTIYPTGVRVTESGPILLRRCFPENSRYSSGPASSRFARCWRSFVLSDATRLVVWRKRIAQAIRVRPMTTAAPPLQRATRSRTCVWSIHATAMRKAFVASFRESIARCHRWSQRVQFSGF